MRSKKLVSLSLIMLILGAVLLITPLSTKASDYSDSFPYIYDEASLLSSSELKKLNDKAAQISQKHNFGVYTVILNDYYDYGNSVENVADSIYYNYDLGVAPADGRGDNNGILLLLSMDDRDYDINAHGWIGNEAFSYDGKIHLEESFLPELGNNEWYNGIFNYLATADDMLSMAENGTPWAKNNTSTIVICAVLIFGVGGLIGAGLNISRLKKQLKSVILASSASNYVDGQLNLTINVDRYTHTTTYVVKDPEKSSGRRSGGGGSSHRSGKF